MRSKETIIRDETISRLARVFSKPEHVSVLEQMTKGPIFDQWIEMTCEEMSALTRRESYTPHMLDKFLDVATKCYADSYIAGLLSMSEAVDDQCRG